MRHHPGIRTAVLLFAVTMAAATAWPVRAGDAPVLGGETKPEETPLVGRSRYDPPGYRPINPPPRPPLPPPPPPYRPYPPHHPYPPPPPHYDAYAHAREINRQGVNAYSRGDYNEAFQLYLIAKDLGYPAAFTNIGVCYQNGLGAPQSYYEAARWFYEASLRGHELGRQYLHNLLVAGLAPPPPYPDHSPYYPPPIPTPSPVYARPGGLGATVGGSAVKGAGLPAGTVQEE